MKNVRVWKRVLMVIIVLFTVSTVTVKAEEKGNSGDNYIQQDMEHKKEVTKVRESLAQTYRESEVREMKKDMQGKDFEDKEIYEEAIDELLGIYKTRNLYIIGFAVFMTGIIIFTAIL